MTEVSSDFTPVSVFYLRKRNVLLLKGNFTELFVDFILHLSNIGLSLNEKQNHEFQSAIAAICLYAATRPPTESVAWTLHFESPLRNLFLVADNHENRITGTLFTESVKEMGRNLLYSDWMLPGRQVRRSTVEIPSTDPTLPAPLRAAQELMLQSEQRTARYFQLDDDTFALATAQPDCDTDWLLALTSKQLPELEKSEEVKLLETRAFRWACGCDHERILGILGPALAKNLDLFGNDEAVQVRCPRCGTPYLLQKTEVEGFLKTE